jgi:hypothetical protein
MVTPPADPGVVKISETSAGPPGVLPGEEPTALATGVAALEAGVPWLDAEELTAAAASLGALEPAELWLAGEKPAASAGGVGALEPAELSLNRSRSPELSCTAMSSSGVRV